ncbi:hypothetical protein [Chromobacterium sp. IIBBL 290-4]|uniref:hypothetical protein n=1 Tax=Chromobacterium sp. IIBBL 290-4 TaxID=2953890 RepID=UPI0020B8DB3B|nr:hypothetical protein [Chromobacterium sp. IIBBL 290-4]UTH74136.1 hypothetical protein NKT35_21750 [Chromobacterium sp. IIBBL 290-4]
MFNKVLAGCLLLSSAAHAETIDAFAKSAMPKPLPAIQSLPPLPMASAGGLAPPSGGGEAGPEFDLLIIQSNGQARRAYLLIQGKYAKTVKAGDKLKSWKVSAVGEDYVDLISGGKRKRLLMDSGAAAAESR